MNWLARLKNLSTSAETEPTKPTEGAFVGSVGSVLAPTSEISASVNDPEFAAEDPDRDCWPHSSAMTGAEIDKMQTRVAIFTRRGVRHDEAEALADKMVIRDREGDDRRTCLECSKLQRGMTCAAWNVAGAGKAVGALVRIPQRCPGFGEAS